MTSESLRRPLPGVALTVALAAISIFAAKTDFFAKTLHMGPLLLVILLGMGLRSAIHLPEAFNPGIAFSQKGIMRLAVAGLGFRLTLQELAAIGAPALVVVLISTVSALIFGWWIAQRMGLDEKLGVLLGVGGAVCGASAVIAADSVVQARKAEASFALAIITLLGTIGILIYPIVGRAAHMPPKVFAVWDGASIHEVAQVAAAADTFDPADTQGVKKNSAVVKLARVALLAPVVFFLSWDRKRKNLDTGQAKVPLVPWFLALFLVFAGLASTGWISGWIKTLQDVDLWLLSIGMAGVGLASGFKDLKAAGLRPIAVGAAQWALLAIVSYLLTIAIV